MQQMISLSNHLTESDLAKRWNVAVKTIQAQRQRGAGPKYMKLGAAVRYRLTDVEEFESANTRASTAMEAAA
jgi:hypothetical protein